MPESDEVASFYPHEYWWSKSRQGLLTKLEAAYRRLALRDHVSFIRRAAGANASAEILDVGCGSGTLLGLLKNLGFHVRGVDFSAEAAKIAAAENGVNVFVGSLEQASFPAASFDVVTLFHVMEHVTDPRRVLEEVFRILRPGGAIVLQVPNIDSWQFRMFGARWYGLDIPRHVIDYSKDGILRLLNETGFKPRRVRHFNLRDNAPAFVSSLFPSLDPISRAVRARSRKAREAAVTSWVKHVTYLMLVVSAYPAVIAESAVGRGATVMIEARKT